MFRKISHLKLIVIVGVIAALSALIFFVHPASRATTTPNALRVIEVRYYPHGPTDVVYNPDDLSSQLQTLLASGSAFHGSGDPAINVQVVGVYNRNETRPNTDGNWGTTYAAILAEDNLCQVIHDQKIDQVWLWVDPRTGYDPNPGVEYAISSNMFQNGLQFVTAATPAFCNGQESFVIMGFDDTRTVDYAQHSFGHLMEGLVGNLQTVELFWYRFAGNTSQGYTASQRCGNVHFPPNTTTEYDYSSTASATTNFCQDWHPDGSGSTSTVTCSTWGCTQGGYLTWWMQNMPNTGNTLTYQSLKLPSWWDFLYDMDYTIPTYYRDSTYFMNRSFLDQNTPIATNSARVIPTPTPTPSPTPGFSIRTHGVPSTISGGTTVTFTTDVTNSDTTFGTAAKGFTFVSRLYNAATHQLVSTVNGSYYLCAHTWTNVMTMPASAKDYTLVVTATCSVPGSTCATAYGLNAAQDLTYTVTVD
ncbi:MAG TPA: hypothetical protein VLH19_01805 [Patescibacteria group bacterium]|nr:hypothetical protein [Patescibacteria group bacterium]